MRSRRGAIAAKRRASGPAAFPSRLETSGRSIVDANGVDVGLMHGFNLHAIADFAQTHFDDIAALGGTFIRVIVRWDNYESTSGTLNGLSGDTNGQGGTATGVMLSLDHTITRAAAAGLYVMIDLHLISGGYPTWTSAQAAGEQKFKVYGQNWVQKLANRYGNPSSPQYAPNVIGMGPNEIPVDDGAVRSPARPGGPTNTSIPYLEAIHRIWIAWMRAYAPDWIGFVGFGYGSQTPYIVAGETDTDYTEASPTAYVAVGGNVVLDLHDYVMGDIRTSPPYDARQFNGQLYPAYQGGPGLGAGDTPTYARSALSPLQMAAYVQPYVDYSVDADIPLMIGEWGWPIMTGGSPQIITSGEAMWLDDKQPTWAAAQPCAILQWNYDVTSNYDPATGNPFSARPNGHWRYSIQDEFGGPNGVIASDDFSAGTTGAIAGRSGWASVTGYANWTVGSGEAYCSGAEAWAYRTAVPDTVEYEVNAELHVRSLATSVIGVALGMTGGATRTAYVFTYQTDGNMRWLKIVNGTVTQIDTFAIGTPTVGDVFRIGIGRSSQGYITCYIDNDYMFEDQDTSITTKGYGGFYATGAVTATTGIHFTQVQVSNVVLDLP